MARLRLGGGTTLEGGNTLVSTAVVNPKLATLVDSFGLVPGPPDPTKWNLSGFNVATNIRVNAGSLQITNPAGNTTYQQVWAWSSGNYAYFDLTASQASIQLLSAGTQTLASLECYPLYLTDETYNAASANKLFWYVNGNNIAAYKWVNGVQTRLGFAAYSASTYSRLRIREAGGTIYFDYSTNGILWTNFASTLNIPHVTNLNLWIQNGTYASEASASTCQYTSLNVPQFSAKIATLTDDFITPGTPNTTNWQTFTYGVGGTAQNAGGQLVLTAPANTGSGNGPIIYSRVYYDLTESSMVVNLAGVTPVPGSSANQQLVQFELRDAQGNACGWYLGGYNSNVASGIGIYTGASTLTYNYDPNIFTWLRILHHAGVIYYDYSQDGSNWTNFNSQPDWYQLPNGVSFLVPQMGMISESATNPTQVATFDHFNLPPPASPPAISGRQYSLRYSRFYQGGAVAMTATTGMTVGGGVLFSSLIDNFSSGSLSPVIWNHSATNVNVVAQQLQISSTLTAVEYQLFSVSFYSLISSQVAIQVVNAGNEAINSWEVYPIILQDASNQNRLYWYIIQGAIAAYKMVAGTATQVFFATYSAATHQWLRIREAAGITYWEYSANGIGWTTAHSEADPITETSLQMLVQAGQFNVEAQTTTAILDNVNSLPPVSVAQSATAGMTVGASVTELGNVVLAGGAALNVAAKVTEVATAPLAATAALRVIPIGPKLSTLTDNFATAGVPNATKWSVSGVPAGAAPVNQGGQLVYNLTAGQNNNAALQSRISYDLTESYFLIQVVNAGTPLNTFQSTYKLQDPGTGGGVAQIYYQIYGIGGALKIRAYSNTFGYVNPGGASGAVYDPVAMQWLRIREHSGTLFFDYSADGLVWTNMGSGPDPPSITYLTTVISIADSSTESTTFSVILDNLNLPTPVQGAVAMSATAQLYDNPPYTSYEWDVHYQGAVGWWKLADPLANPTALDYSGHGNAGTVMGGVTFQKAPCIWPDHSAVFDGVSGKIQLPNAAVTIPNGGLFSIEAWYKTTATRSCIYGGRNVANAGNTVFDFSIGSLGGSSGQLAVLIRADDNSGYLELIDPLLTNDGCWHHGMVVLTATQVQLYRDGNMVASGARATTSAITPDNAFIGWEAMNSAYPYFNGSLASIAVYPMAWVLNDIQMHYNWGKGPVDNSWFAWYDASQINPTLTFESKPIQGEGSAMPIWPQVGGQYSYDLGQPSGNYAWQPTYYSTTPARLQNLMPTVWFDGVSNGFFYDFGAYPVNQPVSVVAVVALSGNTGSWQWVFDSGPGRLAMGTDGVNWRLWGGGTMLTGPPALFDGKFHILTGIWNGVSSAMYVDGVQVISGDIGTNQLGGLMLSDLGPIQGPYAEVLVYQGFSSDADRIDIENYLKNKWNTQVIDVGAVAMSATAAMTPVGIVTEIASVPLSASAGMTVSASVKQLANVVLAGGASLTVAGVVTEVAQVPLSATAGMTVAAKVTEIASVPLAATSTLTIAALVTEISSVPLSASAGLTAAARVTQVAMIALSASTGLTAVAAVTQVAVVNLSGTATMTVTAIRTQFALAPLAATSVLTITAAVTEIATLSMVAATTMTVTPGTVFVYYGKSASDLHDGTGAWVNPTNADGAPDAQYATWTAP
jgi:hypothetical protein